MEQTLRAKNLLERLVLCFAPTLSGGELNLKVLSPAVFSWTRGKDIRRHSNADLWGGKERWFFIHARGGREIPISMGGRRKEVAVGYCQPLVEKGEVRIFWRGREGGGEKKGVQELPKFKENRNANSISSLKKALSTIWKKKKKKCLGGESGIREVIELIWIALLVGGGGKSNQPIFNDFVVLFIRRGGEEEKYLRGAFSLENDYKGGGEQEDLDAFAREIGGKKISLKHTMIGGRGGGKKKQATHHWILTCWQAPPQHQRTAIQERLFHFR